MCRLKLMLSQSQTELELELGLSLSILLQLSIDQLFSRIGRRKLCLDISYQKVNNFFLVWSYTAVAVIFICLEVWSLLNLYFGGQGFKVNTEVKWFLLSQLQLHHQPQQNSLPTTTETQLEWILIDMFIFAKKTSFIVFVEHLRRKPGPTGPFFIQIFYASNRLRPWFLAVVLVYRLLRTLSPSMHEIG